METLEKLLLLEILVDNVYFERTAFDPELLQQLRDTNVRFQFYDYPPIDIGEVDFCQTGDTYDNSEVSFKSGKSILFALPDVSRAVTQPFDIKVTVSRKIASKKATPEARSENKDSGVEWNLYDLGKTIISLGESFINLLEVTSYDGVCPSSRTVRDTYPFSDQNGTVLGYVTVFVRLSCFGKIIVTQFQADALEDKSYCFKGGEDEAAPLSSPPVTETAAPRHYGGGEPVMIPPGYMPQPPMPVYPQTIKVPGVLKKGSAVSDRCGRIPSELLSTDSDGEKKGPYCLHRKCPQGFPPPPWISGGRKGPHSSSIRKSTGTPVGAASFHGDNILFQMSDPLNSNAAADIENTFFKVNHEPDQLPQSVQLVNGAHKPETDDDNDVFLLRFGKHDTDNKPAKLIVTMKTPKVPIIREHKCTSNQQCQTDAFLLAKTDERNQEKVQQLASALNLSTRQVASILGME